jgi:hypothetical protein
MAVPPSPLSSLGFGLALALAAATGAAGAASTSSLSISDSVATSIGSLSTSVQRSSDSSSGDDKVAEGDYRVIQVADLAAQGDQPALTRLTLRAVRGADEFYLMLPPVVVAQHALAPGLVINARHKPYGLAFAKAAAQPDGGGTAAQAEFFLVLEDHWRQDLAARPVSL